MTNAERREIVAEVVATATDAIMKEAAPYIAAEVARRISASGVVVAKRMLVID